jgi:Tol biopolymer transport system component
VGDFAAFLADGTQSGRVQLFVAEADGGNVRAVSGGIGIFDGDVLEFAWSPDRQRIAYLKDTDADGHAELFVVDPDGGSPLPLYDPGSLLGAAIADFAWSPTSEHIAFRASAGLIAPTRLHVVPAGGGSAVDVSGSIVLGGGVDEGYRWRPAMPFASDRIAFRGNLLAVDRVDLFTNDLTGTDRKRMNDFTLNPTAVVEGDFAWSFNGTRIAFRGDVLLDGEIGLFTNVGDGGDEVLESDDLGPDFDVASFRWAPNTMMIAYEHDAVFDDVNDVWTVTSPGGARVNRTNHPGPWYVSFVDYQWSPNGAWLAMVDGTYGHLRTSAGGAPGSTIVGYEAESFSWAPDSSAIAYVHDGMAYQTVITVGPDGAGENDLGDTQTTGSSVLRASWSPDSSLVAYVTDVGGDAGYDLRVAPATGGASVLLHDSNGLLNGVQSEAFAPNSQAMAFLGGPFTQNDVYSVLVDGTDETDLTDGLLDTSDAFDLQLK